MIGSGSAFWGDILEPAVAMAERADVSYMGFDHLSELTMAILNRAKSKDSSKGFIPDIVPWMEAILPAARRRGIRVLSNGGGANPIEAARAVARAAEHLGLRGLRIGVVSGDDFLGKIDELRGSGWKFANLDTEEEDIGSIRDRLVSANAYIGSERIIEALAAESDVVVTGRVSDNALFVGPLMHEFGWDFSEQYVDRIAAAITVGHVIECSGCATGGMSNMWRLSDPEREIGFPIAEFEENGEAVITKTPETGGVVNEWTIKEHLLYEVQDPNRYVMPDGVADFTAVKLKGDGKDRVRMTGMQGWGRPDAAKACLGYTNGWIGEGMAFFPWPDALEKAEWAKRWISARLKRLAVPLEELQIDFVGGNMLHGQAAPPMRPMRSEQTATDSVMAPNEVGLRVAARALRREHAEVIRREITHLWTMGPIGTSITVPARARPVLSLWPTLVPWEALETTHEQIEVPR